MVTAASAPPTRHGSAEISSARPIPLPQGELQALSQPSEPPQASVSAFTGRS